MVGCMTEKVFCNRCKLLLLFARLSLVYTFHPLCALARNTEFRPTATAAVPTPNPEPKIQLAGRKIIRVHLKPACMQYLTYCTSDTTDPSRIKALDYKDARSRQLRREESGPGASERSPDIGALGMLACFDTFVNMFLSCLRLTGTMFSDVRSDEGFIYVSMFFTGNFQVSARYSS